LLGDATIASVFQENLTMAEAAPAAPAAPAKPAVHAKPAGRPTVTIGPGNIDARWHFAPVDCVLEQKGGQWVIGSNDTAVEGRGPDKKHAFREWMVAVARRYNELADRTASHTPEEAKEWKWMEKNVQRLA